jgi:chromosome segregation ATPase
VCSSDLEINRLIDLNPKERCELIDIAAGIKEFEYKKKEALAELEKVGAKVGEAQVMLAERMNFLRELEREKDVAEKYTSMSRRLKILRYSVLRKRRDAVQSTLDAYTYLED